MITFRGFTKADWMAYADCESACPRIYDTPEVTVVIDGRVLSAEVPSADGQEREIFAGQFPTIAAAEDAAHVIAEHPEQASRLLGESVGTC